MRNSLMVSALVLVMTGAASGIETGSAAGGQDREVTIPAGTVLRVRLTNRVGSDVSRVEDPVHAALARPVIVNGRTVVPAGSAVSGVVTEARRPGRVQGRARLGVRFNELTPANTNEHYRMTTRGWVRQAPSTRKKDAATIALPAVGGAAVGAIVGGKKGAAIGGAAGGGAGTGAVLATRGPEVRLGRGAILLVRLTQPLRVRVR
jgi:hypothetical protein